MAAGVVRGGLLRRTPLLVRSLLMYGVIAGVFMLAGWYQSTLPQATVAALPAPRTIVAQEPERVVIQGLPVRITVERLGIDLPINQGTYDAKTGEWTLSDTAAYFAVITDQPNDLSGSTFVYGHNRASVFEPLADIQVGDVVRIYTDNNYIFTYTYAQDASVTPDMTDVLYEHPTLPRLVLMTCEGIWSATRRIMYFTYVGVEEQVTLQGAAS